MREYIKLIIVSYATRKVLSVKESGRWGLLKVECEEMEIDALLKKVYFEKLGQNYNFCMANEKIKEKDNCLIRYMWVFTCSEHFEKSNVEYCWCDIEELCESEDVKRYIKKYIDCEIIIRCEKIQNLEKDPVVKSAEIQSSKQAYSRVLPLKILHPEICIENTPLILDVFYMRQVLEKSNQTQGEFVLSDELCYSWGVINMLPLMLRKHRRVIIQRTPAGCQIGDRSLDLYLYVLRMFGVHMKFEEGEIILEYVEQDCERQIEIPIFASFTATSMAVYFALLGSNITVIKSASIEPEILFLLESIEKIGYKVYRKGRTIEIDGRRNTTIILNQKIFIPVDRNVLVTQLIDAIYEEKPFCYISESNLYLEELIEKLKEFNVEIQYDGKKVCIDKFPDKRACSQHLVFGHYPDLCTDWQPLLTMLCAISEKEVVVYDKIFNDRYRYMAQLKEIYPKLETKIFKNLVIIKNFDKNLQKSSLDMHEFPLLDIRAAAAIIIALSKCSRFCLSNVTQLLRGYEDLYQISEYIGESAKYEFREKISETI